MGLFDKVKKTTIESRRYEEKLYEVALEEVEAGELSQDATKRRKYTNGNVMTRQQSLNY